MEEKTLLVRMAEMAVTEDGTRLKTVLGSCVGLFVHDRERRITALAHIMLPARLRGDAIAAKYADTAVPALLEELACRGSRREDLLAYLTGGAHLFARSEDARIAGVGDMNVEAVRDMLGRLGVEIAFEETGGERGRIVLFDNRSGTIDVKTLDPPVFRRTT